MHYTRNFGECGAILTFWKYIMEKKSKKYITYVMETEYPYVFSKFQIILPKNVEETQLKSKKHVFRIHTTTGGGGGGEEAGVGDGL